MRIVFFSNTLNRHQSNLSDALFELTGGDFTYIETVAPTKENHSGGKKKIDRSYVLSAYADRERYETATLLARDSDIAIFGADSFSFEIERMSSSSKLSFEMSERFFKRGWINILSPRLIKKMWYYHRYRWSKKPLYKLCSSAFAAKDQYRLFSFKNRCYKWGYFTQIDNLDISRIIDSRNCIETSSDISKLRPVRLMWCARFLNWKHPELPLHLAARLKSNGYSFILDMYGSGELLGKMKRLSSNLQLDDVVHFAGDVSNDEVLLAMRYHDIFLFTSDRREGWGAVLNEAMSNGCTVVASNAIGSAPFLIEDGVNGVIFKSCDIISLYEKVIYLIDNRADCSKMAIAAYKTMRDVWSPYNAASNFLVLCQSLLKGGNDDPIKNGPCSKALPNN